MTSTVARSSPLACASIVGVPRRCGLAMLALPFVGRALSEDVAGPDMTGRRFLDH